MLRVRYTAWDGTQQVRLTADKLFDKLGELLSYTDDVQQALDWLLHQGLEWEGIRVRGLDDLLAELRNAMRERMQDVHLRDAFAELRERLRELGRAGFGHAGVSIRHGHPEMLEEWADVLEGV